MNEDCGKTPNGTVKSTEMNRSSNTVSTEYDEDIESESPQAIKEGSGSSRNRIAKCG